MFENVSHYHEIRYGNYATGGQTNYVFSDFIQAVKNVADSRNLETKNNASEKSFQK
jgi:hypothetical protein